MKAKGDFVAVYKCLMQWYREDRDRFFLKAHKDICKRKFHLLQFLKGKFQLHMKKILHHNVGQMLVHVP